MKLINGKHRFFNIWKKSDLSAYNTYKLIRNSTNRLLRKASNEYTKKMFESLPELKQQKKSINTKLKHEVKK